MYPAEPMYSNNDPLRRAMIDSFRQRYLSALRLLLDHAGIDSESLLEAPAQSDSTCRTYCPRCEMQFVLEEGKCVNCGGIPLQAMKMSPEGDR